jgi:N-acetylneuraminic acid mutarotase
MMAKKKTKKKPTKKTKKKVAKRAKKPVVDPFYPLHPAFSGEYQKPKDPPKRGRWMDTGSMFQSRYFQKSVLLKDGKVMVAGGQGPEHMLETVEVWDADTGQWSPTGNMAQYRVAHTLVLLASGKVLAAGGFLDKSAEIWAASDGKWSPAKDLPLPTWGQSQASLPDGRVLLIGGMTNKGYAEQGPLPDALIFNPKGKGWKKIAGLQYLVGNLSTTPLADGRVLVSGGRELRATGQYVFFKLGLIFNPKTNKWKETGRMRSARSLHTLTLLADGRVLAAGGEDRKGFLKTTEIMDPKSGRWRKLAPMNERRRSHTATLLTNGRVLVTGGENQRGSLSSAEIWDPKTKSWILAAPMKKQRSCHTANLLPDGRVLIVGGRRSLAKESATRDAAIWEPT